MSGEWRVASGDSSRTQRQRTKDFWVCDLDEVDFVVGAEGLDKFDVLSLGACLDENAQMGLTFVEGLGTLADTTSETIVLQGVFYDLICGCTVG